MSSKLNLEIGTRIRNKREYLGYTREQLAEKLDLSPKHVGDIEIGAGGMSTAVLIRMCQVLNVTADYILFGKEEYTNNSPIIDAFKTVDEKHVASAEELLKVFIKALDA